MATYNYETNTQVKIERPKSRIFLVSLKKERSSHACKRYKRSIDKKKEHASVFNKNKNKSF